MRMREKAPRDIWSADVKSKRFWFVPTDKAGTTARLAGAAAAAGPSDCLQRRTPTVTVASQKWWVVSGVERLESLW